MLLLPLPDGLRRRATKSYLSRGSGIWRLCALELRGFWEKYQTSSHGRIALRTECEGRKCFRRSVPRACVAPWPSSPGFGQNNVITTCFRM